jgi:topoisomerase-4 subunit A
VVNVLLRQVGSIKKLKWDLDFSDVIIKGRASKGNIVTKYSVKRIELKEKGVSTLKPRKIWFDDVVQRLNVDGRGSLLGAFKGDDLLLVITSKGVAKTMTPELSLHFDEDMIVLEKWNPNKPISAVYYDGDKKVYYLKRFLIEQPNREDQFISEHPDSFLELVSTDWRPLMELEYRKPKGKEAKPNELINIEEFIAVKGIKAQGNILTKENIKGTNLLDSLPYQEEEEKIPEEIEVVNEQELTSTDSKEEDEQSDTPSPTANNTDQPTLF